MENLLFLNGTILDYNKPYPIAFMNSVELQNLLNTTYKSCTLFSVFRKKPMRGCDLINLTTEDIDKMRLSKINKDILISVIEKSKVRIINRGRST